MAAQGLPALALLLDARGDARLPPLGVECAWRAVESHGAPGLAALTRGLAAAGLAPRLLRELEAAAGALAAAGGPSTPRERAAAAAAAAAASEPPSLTASRAATPLATASASSARSREPTACSAALASLLADAGLVNEDSEPASAASSSTPRGRVDTPPARRWGWLLRVAPAPYTSSKSTPSPPSSPPADRDALAAFVDRAANLVLVLSCGDGAARAALAAPAPAAALLRLLAAQAPLVDVGGPASDRLTRRLLRSLRNVADVRSAVDGLVRAGAVKGLVPFLHARGGAALDAVTALSSLCRGAPQRLAAAAGAGAGAPLVALLSRPPPLPSTCGASPPSPAALAFAAAVPLLCGMVHSSRRARRALWRARAPAALVSLARDARHQAAALGALAHWVAAERARMGRRLAADDAAGALAGALAPHLAAAARAAAAAVGVAPSSDGEEAALPSTLAAVSALSEPLLRVLDVGRVARAAARTGLARATIDLLAALPPSGAALAQLPLLDALASMYRATRHPRAFVAAHEPAGVLARVAAPPGDGGDGDSAGAAAVRARAAALLAAFAIINAAA